MIDAKQAIYVAKQRAADMLNQTSSNVEEIERDSYKGRDVWSITLSFFPSGALPQSLAQLPDLRQYKRFLIDVETQELLAMKIREVASQ
jgi:hypothetical protein